MSAFHEFKKVAIGECMVGIPRFVAGGELVRKKGGPDRRRRETDLQLNLRVSDLYSPFAQGDVALDFFQRHGSGGLGVEDGCVGCELVGLSALGFYVVGEKPRGVGCLVCRRFTRLVGR